MITVREEIAWYLSGFVSKDEIKIKTDRLIDIIQKQINELIKEEEEDLRWRGCKDDVDYLPIDKIKKLLS
jgi:hypothetical protein